jgi:hypothetical protein
MTMVEDMERLEKNQQDQRKIIVSILSRLEKQAGSIEYLIKYIREVETKMFDIEEKQCATSSVKDAATQQKLMKSTVWTAIRRWLSLGVKDVEGK